MQALRIEDELDDKGDDPFTAKMSFEVRGRRVHVPPAGRSSWAGERKGEKKPKVQRIIFWTCLFFSPPQTNKQTTNNQPHKHTAGGIQVRPRQSQPLGAALHEQEGRAHQALAAAAQVGILPLAAARREHHHVPHLLQGAHTHTHMHYEKFTSSTPHQTHSFNDRCCFSLPADVPQ